MSGPALARAAGGAAAGISVSTDAVHHLVSELRASSAACRAALDLIRTVRVQQHPAHRLGSLQCAEAELSAAADGVESLARSLSLAGELYTAVERMGAATVELLASQLASVAGFIAARVGLLLLPTLVSAAAQTAALLWLLPESTREAIIDRAAVTLQSSLPALGDPAMLEAIRGLLTLADDAVLGALGVPPSVVAVVGETGLGFSDIGVAATAALGLAALAGGSGVDPVRVDRLGSDLRRGSEAERPVAPPRTVADRVGRIPDPSVPIRIERYPLPTGGHRFEVYIAGTDVAADLGGDRPWDMASNIALIGGHSSTSEQAVRAALTAEGVTASSPVVFTGYSQGGAIATRLAESGDYRTSGLVTVGAPSGAIPVRGDYPAIVIEHRDDLVPVLSGVRRDTTAVIVRADGLDAGTEPGPALAAHDLGRYLVTASRADAHHDTRLRSAIDALPSAEGGDHGGEVAAYTATRIPSTAR